MIVMTHDVKEAFSRAIELIAGAMDGAVRSINAFSDAHYKWVLSLYNKENGATPGSGKTRRLRKKQRKAVMSWYLRYTNSLESNCPTYP